MEAMDKPYDGKSRGQEQENKSQVQVNKPENNKEESGVAAASGDRVESEDGPGILARASEILKEYDNKEAEVPLSSEYWSLMNKYRSLTPKQKSGK